jgi:hypothetical protein
MDIHWRDCKPARGFGLPRLRARKLIARRTRNSLAVSLTTPYNQVGLMPKDSAALMRKPFRRGMRNFF